MKTARLVLLSAHSLSRLHAVLVGRSSVSARSIGPNRQFVECCVSIPVWLPTPRRPHRSHDRPQCGPSDIYDRCSGGQMSTSGRLNTPQTSVEIHWVERFFIDVGQISERASEYHGNIKCATERHCQVGKIAADPGPTFVPWPQGPL